jgi:hypothetical protein
MSFRSQSWLACGLLATVLTVGAFAKKAQDATVSISIDAAANRHKIDQRVYGLAYATPAQLRDLRVPTNRMGGNNTSSYNWKLNADNRANDWYFESIADGSATAGERGDSFIANSRAGGAEPMLTIPMLDWVAKVGPGREKLASFSVKKYGPQQKTDAYMADAGNGLKPDGKPVTGNDPEDSNVRNSVDFEQEWVRHLVQRHGTAAKGGLRYYILDNEPGLWHGTHRDVQPVGIKAEALRDRILAYASDIKAIDPGALIVAPEEWGWSGYIYSPYDHWYGGSHGWSNLPERTGVLGGRDFMPWLLDQFRQNNAKTGKRVVDIFTAHIYPQGGEFGEDTSPAMQDRRNRSTRSLWDPNYKDETWINEKVRLIPRLKEWVKDNYPATQIGITEYNWGAEGHINGATAQADILCIFGREGLDLANRWTTPATNTPTYKAIKLYRNYDDKGSAFGDVSVRADAPDSDKLSTFAAVRSSDGALTVMVVRKERSDSSEVTINLANFAAGGAAQAWQLTAANKIERLPDTAIKGIRLETVVPAQSVTLFVIPSVKR